MQKHNVAVIPKPRKCNFGCFYILKLTYSSNENLLFAISGIAYDKGLAYYKILYLKHDFDRFYKLVTAFSVEL